MLLIVYFSDLSFDPDRKYLHFIEPELTKCVNSFNDYILFVFYFLPALALRTDCLLIDKMTLMINYFVKNVFIICQTAILIGIRTSEHCFDLFLCF